MSVILSAPAKINWFLHLNGQRDDGYHLLQTYFQFVTLSDSLNFEVVKNGAIEVISAIPFEENIVTKAAHLLHPHAPDLGIRIHLTKRIPMGGGLGGGSSNAATTLHALNRLWNLNLSDEALLNYALRLGADVPVFVGMQAALAEGIGEKLHPHSAKEHALLIVAPNCHIETAKIFRHPELTRSSPPCTMDTLKARDFSVKHRELKNNFEPLVRKLYTAVADAMDWLSMFSQPFLSGSGSCVFAPFASEQQAEEIAAQLPAGMKGYVVRSLNHSPLKAELELLKL